MNRVQKLASLYLGAVLFFGWGFAIGKYQVFPYSIFIKDNGVPSVDNNSHPADVIKEIRKEVVKLTGKPVEHITESQPRLSNPVNDTSDLKGKYLMLVSWYNSNNAVRIIDEKGKVVKEWTLDINKAFPKKKTDKYKVDINGVEPLPDGSVIGNFEYNGVARVDKCNNVLWSVPSTHHSVFRTDRDTFWVPGVKRRFKNIKTLSAPLNEDYLMEISQDGKILRNISILDIIFANDLQGLIIHKNFNKDNMDVTHLNDIQELSPQMAHAFPQFSAGDLLVSLRTNNIVMVIDPKSLKVKWYHVGAWLHQHNPSFEPDGTISIFNNNSDDLDGDTYGGSNIIKINPTTRETTVLYKAENFFSTIRGTHYILPNNHILITEFSRGRVFIANEKGKVIYEYTNKYSKDEFLKIITAKLIDKKFFTANLKCGTL